MQRIQDLADRFEIYALCPPCGRMEALPCAELLSRFGAEVTITDIRPRLRCRECGTRSGEVRVVYVGPEGRPATFRYRSR